MAVHLNDVGTVIKLDTGIDLTGATVTDIRYKKPNGSVGNWTGSIDLVDDNLIVYTVIAGDLNQTGKFWVQALVSIGGWTGHGVKGSFQVLPLIA